MKKKTYFMIFFPLSPNKFLSFDNNIKTKRDKRKNKAMKTDFKMIFFTISINMSRSNSL